MNRIYLVRHGENPANITKQFSSRHVDHELTPKGVLQAEQTAAHLRGKGIAAVYCSPLRRAVQTAEIIAAPLGLPVGVVEGFREIDVGEMERQPATAEAWAYHNEVLGSWLSGDVERAFPGGDSFVTLCARMRAGLEEALRGRRGQNIVIVGHGGIFTMTMQDLCPGVDMRRLIAALAHNCSISELLLRRAAGRLLGELVSWGVHEHLHGAAADLVPGIPTDEGER
ncbi:MAG TPA: histidine phosphatase family protein [Anaerolineae bacterium]|nr:histidine phosphatase family protein [Anaerolineae bacterium]HOQ99356.1 histidine phosphatase family protein [Anaerolineae bacterium]HPL26793.1 histidine phosphatase family protein [Anaerolineae bacterium]